MLRTRSLLVAASGVGIFLAVAFAPAAPAAIGDGSSVHVDRQAWARTGPAAPPMAKDGHLYVSAAGGQEQARAFVHVDAAGAAAADLEAATVVFAPADDGVMPSGASLVACALTQPFTGTGELSDPPSADCTRRANLKANDDGTFSLPLAPFAEEWVSGDNQGIVVMPDPAVTTSLFTVAVDSTKTAVQGAAAPPAAAEAAAPSPSEPATAATLPAPAVGAADIASPATGSVEALSGTNASALPAAPAPQVAIAAAAPTNAPAAQTAAPSPRQVFDAVRRTAAHPSAVLILVPALLAAALMWTRTRKPRVHPTVSLPARTLGEGALWILIPAAAMTLGETTIYKLGLVGVAFIAAIGLHLLVNWTGELSLAHAGFIGVPAFAVAQLSSHSGLSPIVGLPLAIAVGVALGSIVGIAALRSRGLQVALVTLAFGIAIGQFLFFRTWLVGPNGGLQMPLPSIFGLELRTNRALLPLLAATVLLAVLAARSIMHSTIGRALLLVRANPEAAAAAGIAVARHRALAYAFAGGFAGIAGWTYVVWVQQVSAKAFPLELGFTYLVIAALAGPGGLAGVAMAALVIEGGALFSILPHSLALYLAPIALIVNVTRYQEGFNGVLRAGGRAIATRTTARRATMRTPRAGEIRLSVVFGTAAVVAGFAAIGLAWYHMGNTDAVWVQNQELVSGGVAGLGLIVVGAVLLVRDALLNRAALGLANDESS